MQISFDATFPIDYRVETLAGKTARFDVTVKEVAHAHVPELDDDILQDIWTRRAAASTSSAPKYATTWSANSTQRSETR